MRLWIRFRSWAWMRIWIRSWAWICNKTLDQILGLDMELDNEFLDFGPGVGWDIHQTPDLPCISHART